MKWNEMAIYKQHTFSPIDRSPTSLSLVVWVAVHKFWLQKSYNFLFTIQTLSKRLAQQLALHENLCNCLYLRMGKDKMCIAFWYCLWCSMVGAGEIRCRPTNGRSMYISQTKANLLFCRIVILSAHRKHNHFARTLVDCLKHMLLSKLSIRSQEKPLLRR